MIVKEILDAKQTLITLNPQDTIGYAKELMQMHKIRHLPIVTPDHQLIGIVSDRDLRDASSSVLKELNEEEENQAIEEIMTTNIITGTQCDFIEDIASLFYEFKISCVPILDEEKLVGIITESDLLRTFLHITGASEPSSHIELKLKHHQGSLCGALQVFLSLNLNITNILMYPAESDDYKRLVIRAHIMNTDELVDRLIREGYEVLWPQKKR